MQRLAQQPGDEVGAVHLGRGDLRVGVGALADAVRCGAHLVCGGQTEHEKRCSGLVRIVSTSDQRSDLGEVGGGRLQQRERLDYSGVLAGGEFATDGLPFVVRVPGAVGQWLARRLEPRLGRAEGAEAEKVVDGVVQFAGAAVDESAELAVGQERAVGLHRLAPRGTVEVLDLGFRPLPRPPSGVKLVRRRPAPLDPSGAARARGDQVDRDGRLAVGVKVAPALLPDVRAVQPAATVAGQDEFGGLGEARLPRSVAAGDQGQARAGFQRKERRAADTAEALGVDRGEVDVRVRGLRLLRGVRGRGGLAGKCLG